MENIIFDKWIELGGGYSGFLKLARKTDKENAVFLLIQKDTSTGILKTYQLTLKGRRVYSQNGIRVDFGDAYPCATSEGKISITKKFMKAFFNQ